MYLQELFNQRHKDSVVFKAETEDTVTISEEEKEKVLKAYLYKKIAEINSVNYQKAVCSEPVYKKPTFNELHDALVFELTSRLGWVIDQFNAKVIQTLCYYFTGDENFELIEDGYSLSKGLIMIGPVGCGKTSLLKLLQKNSFNPYRVISCRKVAAEYADHGNTSISIYSSVADVPKREFFGHSTIGYGFDDLGTEEEKKNFGNKLNVMAEIILNRYDFIEAKNKTHITTNLSADEILQYYGSRAYSRLKEMVNIIEFPFDAPDRRK